jgi:hypothetical protein
MDMDSYFRHGAELLNRYMIIPASFISYRFTIGTLLCAAHTSFKTRYMVHFIMAGLIAVHQFNELVSRNVNAKSQ